MLSMCFSVESGWRRGGNFHDLQNQRHLREARNRGPAQGLRDAVPDGEGDEVLHLLPGHLYQVSLPAVILNYI